MGELKQCPIIVLGPPRSGTSITARIIQAHIGRYPFAVSRHDEPEELVQIHREWIERQGGEFVDRFYFPDIEPDLQLFEDTVDFFHRYKDVACVVKEPITTILYNWIKMPMLFPTISVTRSVRGVADSLSYHKRFETLPATALSASRWYEVNRYEKFNPVTARMYFVPDKEKYYSNLSSAMERVGLRFDEAIASKYWDQTKIEYYKKDNEHEGT